MVAYNRVVMKIKKVVVSLLLKLCDSVQFLEPKNSQQGGQRSQNNDFQDYGQGFGGQQSGQNTSYNNNNSSKSNQSDNPFANANGPIDISDDDLPF